MFWNKKGKAGWRGSKLNEYGMMLQTDDYSVIPWIFCALAENCSTSKTAAARMLSNALDKLTFDNLASIDRQMRQTTSMEWSVNRSFPIKSQVIFEESPM
jgi:hypothetical protein